MWAVMMAAMMTPATAPMIVAFATINRRRKERSAPYVATAIFLAGYLLAWTGFSALAAGAQILLQAGGLLDPMMTETSGAVAASLFLVAGLYQWTPLKDICLTRCRSTEGFILSQWRDGPVGAVVMGFRHGLFCIGCCAALMALLFAVSVMDLAWMAALTALVMVEKLLPHPHIWRRLIGTGLVTAAAATAVCYFVA
jgi:predicted metal-binding membrane protein